MEERNMNLVSTETAAQRSVARPLLAHLLATMALALAMGASVLLWQSPMGRVGWALVRAFCHLVPPVVWLGGAAAVALWLIAIRRLW
jgi:hypothetical protein